MKKVFAGQAVSTHLLQFRINNDNWTYIKHILEIKI